MPTVETLLHGNSVNADSGSFGFCSITLVRGEKLTLVDSGHVGRRRFLVQELGERGLTPADIDITVVTHAHWDHAQNYDLFEAPLLIHTDELKYVRKPHDNDWATPRWTAAMLEFESRVQQVDEGYEIEPGVRIMHTPGHSAGTVAVIVDTDAGSVAITGDGIQSAVAAITKQNALIFWNEREAQESIERILQTAETVYPGHDVPFRMLRNGGYEYLVPKQMLLSGLDPAEKGITFDPTPREPYIMPGIETQTLERLN